MLVLTRRVGEEVVLPGVRVRFTLLSVNGGRIRIGIAAPPAIQVLRGELEKELEKIDDEGLADEIVHGEPVPPLVYATGRECGSNRRKRRLVRED